MSSELDTVTPVNVRRETIRDKSKSPLSHQRFYYYSRPLELPVIEVAVDLPVYRLENARTVIDQRKYIADNKLPSTFFSKGQEDLSAQAAQHRILVAYAKKEKGDTVAIYEVLQQQGQTEELLITPDGVVLNGNRRLAAMRELLAENPSQHRSFQNVRVQVLQTGLSRRDMLTIEARLQAARPTRLDYDWLSELLLLRSLKQEGASDAELADVYRFRNEDEVRQHLTMLDEADIYLDERLHTPGEYERLADSEQLFRELVKATAKVDAGRKEAARAIHHLLIENPPARGRKYDARAAFGRDLDQVVSRLADRHGLELTAAPLASNDDLIPSAEPSAATQYKPVIELLQDRGGSAGKAKAVLEILSDIQQERDEEDRGTIALRYSSEALRKLRAINPNEASEPTRDDVRQVLMQVAAEATRLHAALS